MSLYPIIPITPSGNPIIAPSGNLLIATIDMTTTTMLKINLTHLSSSQDYSLRLWLSVQPDGMALAPGHFPLLHSAMLPIIVYTTGQPPDNTIAIRVSPGQYALNILNLTNEQNVLAFTYG